MELRLLYVTLEHPTVIVEFLGNILNRLIA